MWLTISYLAMHTYVLKATYMGIINVYCFILNACVIIILLFYEKMLIIGYTNN